MHEALVAAGTRIEVHGQHFPKGTKDVEWLPLVGKNGWFALTKDENIGRNALEIEAWRKAGVGLFVFVPKDLTGAAIARIVVQSLPAIYRFIEAYRRRSSPRFTATRKSKSGSDGWIQATLEAR